MQVEELPAQLTCPGCSQQMTGLEGAELPLHKCGECGGLWLDVADLNGLLLHSNLPGLETLGGKVNAEALTGTCPSCQVDMVSVEGGDRHNLQAYDSCESCGGIFLESEFKNATDFQSTQKDIIEFFRRFSGKAKKKAGSA